MADKKIDGTSISTNGLSISLKPEHATAKLGVKLNTEEMSYAELVATAYRMATDRETIMKFDRHIDGEPLDVCRALFKAIKQLYGWSETSAAVPWVPPMINFEVAYGKTEEVPWGVLKIPGLEADISTCNGHPSEGGEARLTLHIAIRKKDVAKIDELIALTRQIFGNSSVYRGQAIELDFNPKEYLAHGAPPVKTPEFLPPSSIKDEDIVFSQSIATQMDVLIHTPILCLNEFEQDGIPTKQTVLLGGEHGTGKTLELGRLQRMAVENGVTYILVPSADNLVAALEWSRKVEPAVLVCEDIDAVVKGERNLEMNELLETIDGIKSKGRRLLLVMTTNFPEEIHPGFIRTGRVDSYIHVTPPDGPAVEKLILQYGRGLIDPEGLDEVGLALAGHKPSTIRGVVERSKMARLNRWAKAGKPADKGRIKASDLMDAIETMKPHFKLMERENQAPEFYTTDDYLRSLIGEEVRRVVKEDEDDGNPPVREHRVPRQLSSNGHTSQA